MTLNLHFMYYIYMGTILVKQQKYVRDILKVVKLHIILMV